MVYYTSMPSYSTNKDAQFKYETDTPVEAGLVLLGWEVKAIKAGRLSLKGSFVKEFNNELYLVNSRVTPLQEHMGDLEEDRARKLLLHTAQVQKFVSEVKKGGYTLVPLRVYGVHGVVKLEIALAKGRKRFEQGLVKKKQALQKRDRQIKKQMGL